MCFALRFFVNLSNNLSYILVYIGNFQYTCFELHFLANLSNNLS